MAYVETAHDYEVRFLECYGVMNDEVIYSDSFYHDEDNKVRMNYMAIERTSRSVGNLELFYYTTKDRKAEVIPFDNDIFILPKLGFINTSFFTVFYERSHKKPSPARYRRGLRADLLNVSNISHYECTKLVGAGGIPFTSFELFNSTVNDLFFPKYYIYEEALESILTYKRLSAAINNSIAMKYDILNNSIQLLKNTWIVGDYSEKYNGFILRTSFCEDDLIENGIKVVS